MKNKEKAMAALLSSDTRTEAAAKAGIADRTLRGYLADESFSAEYKQRKRQLVNDATKQIQESYQSAISALRDIVGRKESSESARISAARALLEYGLKFAEVSDIMERLESLERMVEG